jgi:HPt (histidine-containing phosphotransfer) domain-containing protein
MTEQKVHFAAREDRGAEFVSNAGAAERLTIIDLVHLSRQTLGDAALESELLTLFKNQAQQFAKRLAGPSPHGDEKWRADLAHTLKGSARAVGAFRVARAAENYETAIRSRAANVDDSWRRLAKAIEVTEAEIAVLLERT